MIVRKTGLEPVRPTGHYPLKIACIPISPLPLLLFDLPIKYQFNKFNKFYTIYTSNGFKKIKFCYFFSLIRSFISLFSLKSKITNFIICSLDKISSKELIKLFLSSNILFSISINLSILCL